MLEKQIIDLKQVNISLIKRVVDFEKGNEVGQCRDNYYSRDNYDNRDSYQRRDSYNMSMVGLNCGLRFNGQMNNGQGIRCCQLLRKGMVLWSLKVNFLLRYYVVICCYCMQYSYCFEDNVRMIC